MKKLLSMLLIVCLVLAGCGNATKSEEVNIYTSRDYEVDKKIAEQFQTETGIKLNIVELDNDELVTKVIAEKNAPVADIVIVNGAQYIDQLTTEEVLQPLDPKTISEGVDPKFIGDNFVGLTYRARVVAYDPNKVQADEIKTYNDLTAEKYKDQILVRSSQNGYNQALLMNMIQNNGEAEAQKWANGIVANMARKPEGGDRDQLKAVNAGEGSLAITNSYYYFQMLNSADAAEQEAAKNLKLQFLDDTHINMTWLGLTSKGVENDSAAMFIEYVTSPEVQSLFASDSGEFPVNTKADFGQLEQYRNFSTQPIDFSTLGRERETANKIFTEAGWE